MNFFSNDLELSSKQVRFEDDQVHHFKNVNRGKEGDSVKIFNGRGLVANGSVTELKKKNLTIEIEHCEKKVHGTELNLFLGVPKKEYVESILRSAVQMGIRNLYLIHTKFSPWTYKSTPRLEKILTSALIQSENPYLPEIQILKDLSDITSIPGRKMAFVTEVDKPLSEVSRPAEIKSFIIGPEGGFHLDELDFFQNEQTIESVRFPTPILKAEVAVSFGAGFLASLAAQR